ncbi:MAG: hypothetical protein Q9222_006857 [Ikaeria aurantiellina]
MAAPSSAASRQKPSFASIAAGAARAPPLARKRVEADIQDDSSRTNAPSIPSRATMKTDSSAHHVDRGLRSSLANLNLHDDRLVSTASETPELSSKTRPNLRFDDERSHISTSSTKPASPSGKSTASGATFAMDEKESLRPDDSASVKAAEEEDSYSGTGSGAPSSRVESEAGARAFRDQFHEISERIGRAPDRPVVASHRGMSGVEEEVFNGAIPSMPRALQPLVPAKGSSVVPTVVPGFPIEYRDPDEKLLEALESPKDRLYVLRLEHEIVNFIQNSSDPTLELRSPNSFCRLLTHKLADYYALTHHVDGTMSAVKLYRTPYCRIRTPLTAFPQANVNTDGPPSAQPAVRIMRRAGLPKDGQKLESDPNTTASSVAPSKTGSENGEDSGRVTGLVSPTESDLSKDRLTQTREEREAKYKEARDRIFNDNNDSLPHQEAGLGISRASSSNARRKTRKHRNTDDGFEARSHFTAYYPAVPYSGSAIEQTPAPSAYYHPYGTQQYPNFGESAAESPMMFSTTYGPGFQSMPNTSGYPIPAQQYSFMNGAANGGYNAMQPYPEQSNMQPYPEPMQSMSHQYYQQPQFSPAIGQQSPAMSSPSLNGSTQMSRPHSQTSDLQWSQLTHHYPYQQPRSQQQYCPPQQQYQVPMSSPQTIPYQYGQLPYQPNMPGSRNAHPLPGSYNRQQAFNPQTRSFVPGASSQPSFVGNGLSDASAANQYSGTASSTSSLLYHFPSYPTAQVPAIPQFGSFSPPLEQKPYASRKHQSNSNENVPPAKSSLAKWGTPANLPPKPPPPDPPSAPEGRHSLPQNVPAHSSVPLVSNGQPMPIFHNGVYTLPHQSQQ